MVNEAAGPRFKRVGVPALSADGRVVAYKAVDELGSEFIVVNGTKVSTSFESVTDPAVSRDGKVVAYAAEDDRPLLFVGERRIEIPQMPGSVFLSRDGAAWGTASRTAVATAQGTSESFDEIRSPAFGPDGRSVIFAGRQGQTWFVVAGGRKFEAPGLVGDPVWSGGGKRIGYGALLGRELWWKVISVP